MSVSSACAASHALMSPPLNLSMMVVTNLVASSAGLTAEADGGVWAGAASDQVDSAAAIRMDLCMAESPLPAMQMQTGDARAGARGTRASASAPLASQVNSYVLALRFFLKIA